MALLRSKTGASHELTQDVVVLGRSPDCDVVLEVGAVSRRHAKIVRNGDEWAIEDLNSRNGTILNGIQIEGRQTLRSGDRVRICEVEFVFEDSRQPLMAGIVLDEDDVVADLAPESAEPADDRYRIVRPLNQSLAEECRELRRALEESHLVFYPADSSRLAERLVMGDPELAALRPEHLQYTVVLDGLAGFEGGRFNLKRFYNYVCRQLTAAFGLPQSDTYHEEDVVQILRSAPPSLLCLVNASAIPHRERTSLRGLTQESHPALIVYEGARDVLVDVDFEQTHAEFPPAIEAPRPAPTAESKLRALLEITSVLSRSLDLDTALSGVMDSLMQVFPQADRCSVFLKTPEGTLAPQMTRGRPNQAPGQVGQDIVRRAMETKQVIFSEDVGSDARFEMSQSIADFRIRSVMCVPLLGADSAPLGALQIDTLDWRSPFQREDSELLAAVASQAALAIENSRLFEAALQQQRFQRDLQLARDVQSAFLPAAPPEVPGYTVFQHIQPASAVTSDFFDFVGMPDDRLAFVIGEVVGHGIASAVMATALLRDVQNLGAAAAGACDFLSRLNRGFSGFEGRFAMLALAILEPQHGKVTFASAGHTLPLLRRGDTGEVISIGEKAAGLPLGIDSDLVYEECTFELRHSDVLVLHSDGLDEAMNAEGAIFGTERLVFVLREAKGDATAIGRKLLAQVQQFTAGQSQTDDWCLICLKRESL